MQPDERKQLIAQYEDGYRAVSDALLKITPEEKVLWQRLRTNRLARFHFRRQQVIDGFIVDFYCHAAALIVEVDGPVHAEQVDHDAERDRILSSHGFRVVRFTNEQVRNSLDEVLERIVRLCRGEET